MIARGSLFGIYTGTSVYSLIVYMNGESGDSMNQGYGVLDILIYSTRSLWHKRITTALPHNAASLWKEFYDSSLVKRSQEVDISQRLLFPCTTATYIVLSS